MTNRREFLKFSAAGGAIVATSALPAVATTKDDVFSKRGKWEWLSIGYAVVRVGATKPFFSDDLWMAARKYWPPGTGSRFSSAEVPLPKGDYARQKTDATTRDFITYLKTEPLLKAILAGHEHFDMQDRFSPTAVQYVVGGNYLFHGEEILFI